MFEGGYEKSKKLSLRYRVVADEYGREFFDTSTVMKTSDIDGKHHEPGRIRRSGKLSPNW